MNEEEDGPFYGGDMQDAMERARKKKEPSMGEALDRAHESGGKDVFNAIPESSNVSHISEAVAQLTPPEEAGSKPEARAYGPVEPPPVLPKEMTQGVAPPPPAPPEQSFKPNDFPTAPAAAPAVDPLKQARLDAIGSIQRALSAPRAAPPAGLDDADIAAAQERDSEQNRKDNITSALQAWMMRQPYKPTPSNEAQGLMQRRQLLESEAEKDQQRGLSAAEALAKLKDTSAPGAGGLSEFQKYEMDRNARQDKAKADEEATKKTEAAAQLERDRKMLQTDFPQYDLSQADEATIKKLLELRHAKATEGVAQSNLAIARAQESRNANDFAARGQGIPFAGATLKYTGSGTPTKDDVDKAQNISGLYGAAIEGMNDLENKISAFAKNPSPATKDAVDSAARLVSGHLNTAFGQGAMSKDEASAMASTLGADFSTPAGVSAFFDRISGNEPAAAAALARRLRAARQSTQVSALAKLKPYHFAPEGGSSGGGANPVSEPDRPGSVPANAKLINGKWMYRKDDGQVEVFDPKADR